MKHKLLTLAAVGILTAGAAQAQFITIDEDVKVSFRNEMVSDGNGGFVLATVGSVTIKETDPQGNAVYKTLKEHSIPAEDGGTKKITVETEMIVAEKPGAPGEFIVTTNTTTIETPVTPEGTEGTPVETEAPPVVEEVPQEELELPPTSTVEPLPDVLEETPAVSGQ